MESKLRKAGIGAFVGILIGFGCLGVVALAVNLVSSNEKQYDAVRAEKRLERLQELQKQNHAELDNVGWVDQSKKIAHIPINDAMILAVNTLRNKPVGVTQVPVPTPVPIAVPAADAAASPAPAAAPAPTPAPAP